MCVDHHRNPPFFDDIAARLLPVIPLIIYRLIENDATDVADKVLALYTPLLIYHPLRFTFVRDILAYFYGHLPIKLIVRILKVLDIPKVIILLSLSIILTSLQILCTDTEYVSDSFLRVIPTPSWFK